MVPASDLSERLFQGFAPAEAERVLALGGARVLTGRQRFRIRDPRGLAGISESG